MTRIDEANWKLAQLARWENEGGRCADSKQAVANSSRESTAIGGLVPGDVSPAPGPHRGRPPENSPGTPCL